MPDKTYDELRDELREELKKEGHDPCWDTDELARDFEVLGFSMNICVVRRKFDGQKGSLDFTHSPRLYFNFIEHTD